MARRRRGSTIRQKQGFAVIIYAMALLVLGGVSSFIAAVGWRPEPLVRGTDIIDPSWLVVGVFVSFLVFLIALHVLAIRFAKGKRKSLLQGIEYAYLVLGLLGLAGVTSYGLDRANYFREQKANEVQLIRTRMQSLLDGFKSKLQCDKIVMGDPAGYCRWLRNADTINARSPITRSDIEWLYNRENLPSFGDLNAESTAAELQRSLGSMKKVFELAVERGDIIATLDDTIATAKFPSFLKLYAFYLLAFAIALRLTKVSIESLGLIKKS